MKRFVFALAIGGAVVPVVDVVAITDGVEVKNVTGNRGNCRMTAHRQSEFPQKLKFGQKAVAGFLATCNLVEVEVITDKGDWSFTF